MQDALKNDQTFAIFKSKIESSSLKEAHIETRMGYLLAAIQMGLTPTTALNLCKVSTQEFIQWSENTENREKYDNAQSYAEAQLEFILYSAATKNANLALLLLEKRNPDRWRSAKSDVKSGENSKIQPTEMVVGIKFSDMLNKQPNNPEDFNVTITDSKATWYCR